MCRKLVVINKLVLGNRELGWETWSLPKGELLEFTSKQLKDLIRTGKDEVYGLCISKDDKEQLVFDKENFFTTNMMNKSHINNYMPMEECDTMVNLFYVVLGSHKEKDSMVYDLISSRYEKVQVKEDKLIMFFSMGLISGGAKLEEGKILIASMTKEDGVHQYAEDNKTVEKKSKQKEIASSNELKQQA